ncbi:conserved hypothetical protein [Ricinus communis]|uniref:Retrotransposon gag domain-containing protein n=1 Tax=Ricinus communis TaxID=3988 RepID=B9SZD9_RICCO|nr:conserved hypothetical protein [Ricinus communis]
MGASSNVVRETQMWEYMRLKLPSFVGREIMELEDFWEEVWKRVHGIRCADNMKIEMAGFTMSVGAAEKRKRMHDFERLRQDNMYVQEYTREFVQLIRYASKVVVDEFEKCSRYIEGLDEYYAALNTVLHNGFPSMMDLAMTLERHRLGRIAEVGSRKKNKSEGPDGEQ